MKSFDKTDSSVRELWGIADGLVDNRSPWFIISKNEKAQKPSELTEKPQEAKKCERFQLLTCGDNITKNISASAIVNCGEIQGAKYLTGGSKVPSLYVKIRAFKKSHGEKSVIIHDRINDLPRDNPVDVANKTCKLMVHASN